MENTETSNTGFSKKTDEKLLATNILSDISDKYFVKSVKYSYLYSSLCIHIIPFHTLKKSYNHLTLIAIQVFSSIPAKSGTDLEKL